MVRSWKYGFIPALLLVTVMGLAGQADPGWTEYRGGPDRLGGVSTASVKIPPDWEPHVLWRSKIGSGYSGVVIMGKRAITAFQEGQTDWLGAFETTTGEPLWKIPLEPTYQGHDGSRDGPLATPAVAGDRVIGLSARGQLVAVAVDTGKELWRRDLVGELEIPMPYFGFASSPLIEGNNVILLAGGKENRCLLAFDRSTGELSWSSQSDPIDNASATAVTLGGVRQIVALTDQDVFAVKPDDGKLLWRLHRKPDGWATPLPVGEDRLLIPMDEALIAVRVHEVGDEWKVETLWEMEDFAPYSSFFAVHDSHVYGSSKYSTLCVDVRSGQVAWTRDSHESSATLVGDTLFVLERRSGKLRAIAASEEGFREHATVNLFGKGQHYTPPSFSDGLLFVRSLSELVVIKLPTDGS